MSKKEEHALFSQLVRLMLHIIKWISQPTLRTMSWVFSIKSARHEIDRIENKRPGLRKKFVKKNWDIAFNKAKSKAELEMEQKSSVDQLTEKQVFEDQYDLNNFNKK